MARLFLAFLLLCSALSARAIQVTVPADDGSITYLGGWQTVTYNDSFASPAPAMLNGSVCSINETSQWSPNLGDGFKFSFIGIALSLVMISDNRHGIFNVQVDNFTQQLTGYTPNTYCGELFNITGLQLTQHEVDVMYVAHAAQASTNIQWLSLLSIVYETGTDGQTSPSLTTPLPVRSTLVTSLPGGSSTTSSRGTQASDTASTQSAGNGSGIGGIVGGVVGGLVAGILIALAIAWFWLRSRRRNAGPTPLPFDRTSAAFVPMSQPQPSPRTYTTAATPYEYSSSRPAPLSGKASQMSMAQSGGVAAAAAAAPLHARSESSSARGGAWSEPDVERIANRLAAIVEARQQPALPPIPPSPPPHGAARPYSTLPPPY